MSTHTLKQLRHLAQEFNQAHHIKVNQCKGDLLDSLRRHGVLRNNQQNPKTPCQKGREVCTDEELAYVLKQMHRKYFRKDRSRSHSSRRRRYARKRRRDASQDADRA